MPERLAPLLARRGVGDREEADRFLHPSLDQLHDPFELAGLDQAVKRLLAAGERGERVALIGDYDVDGVTSTALLSAVLGAVGVEVEPILPHRVHDGYGFQTIHVERARERRCDLIVTVDCGVGATAAVEAARQAGIDVIITDHHLPGADPLPAGTLMINPRQEGCDYPFDGLAAVGLSLKLALALGQRSGRELPVEALLRIACLGTIADLVPLVGENRVIAALGLEALGRTRSPGLKALFERARIRPPFSSDDVGYRIGPRLNAAGRLDDAHRALELLMTRDAAEAADLAEQLERWNQERRNEEARVVEEARELLESRSPMPRIAVAWQEGWHRGVVGIAAGRLARKLHRPVLLLAVDGDLATGSGRSIRGLGLHGFLSRWRSRMERFGGHAQAVGLSVREQDLPELVGEWEQAAEEWPDDLLVRHYEYELELAAGEVDESLLAELARLEPHGQDNPRPLLKVGPLRLSAPARRFGRGHLSALATGEGGRVRLLGWRWQEREADLRGEIEVLGFLEHDDYRNEPVVRLLDARPATG